MSNFLDRLSLKARLTLLAVASVSLMLAYVGVNTIVRGVTSEYEVDARQATMSLMAANSAEKDLASLLRDTYLMAAQPTPERIEAAEGNLVDFGISLSDAESTVHKAEYRATLQQMQRDFADLDRLVRDYTADAGNRSEAETGRSSMRSLRLMTISTRPLRRCGTARVRIWNRPGAIWRTWRA